MTLEDQSSDASDILEQALAAHETERLAVRAGFVPTVLDAVPVASSRSWLSANSALIIGAALFLTVSTAVAAIVRYVRQEESVAARVCVECDESQYMNSSRDRHGQPDSILQRNPGNAQVQGSGTVRVTENFRVAGDNYKFFDLRVSSRGRIAVRQGDEQPFMIYSPSNSDVIVFDYASMPELGRLTLNWGWVGGGDSLWVQSVTGVHVIALTPRPRIVSSRAVPAETPGPPGTTPRARNPYPGVDAMYRNGDLLISQAFPEDEARNALGRYDLAGVPTTFRVRTDKDHNVVSFSPGRPVGWEKACERHSASPGLLGPVFSPYHFATQHLILSFPMANVLCTSPATLPLRTLQTSELHRFGSMATRFTRASTPFRPFR